MWKYGRCFKLLLFFVLIFCVLGSLSISIYSQDVFAYEVVRKGVGKYPSFFYKKRFISIKPNEVSLLSLMKSYLPKDIRLAVDKTVIGLEVPFALNGYYSLSDLIDMFKDRVEVRYKNGFMEIKGYIVKRFYLPFPGTSYSVNQKLEAISMSSGVGGTTSSETDTSENTGSSQAKSGNSVEIKTEMKWWDEVINQIKQIIGIASSTGREGEGEGEGNVISTASTSTTSSGANSPTVAGGGSDATSLAPFGMGSVFGGNISTSSISGGSITEGNLVGLGRVGMIGGEEAPFVVYDKFTNTVVVGAPVYLMRRVEKYIEGIKDKLEKTIEVEITLFEVSDTGENYHGVKWTSLLRMLLVKHPRDLFLNSNVFGYGLNLDMGVTPEETGGSLGTVFLKSMNPEDKQKIILTVLSKVAKIKVINRTTLMLKHGTTTSFSVGKLIHYVSSISREITDNGNTYSIEKGTVLSGLVVTLSGFVDGNKIHLTLQPNYNFLVDMQSITAGDTTVQNPIVNVRQNFVTVALRNGETTAILGYDQNSLTQTKEKLPILGDLPMVGWLFSKDVTRDEKGTLVMLITAKVRK